MKKAVAFSPGHITGFFQICDQAANPLLKGSRGAGVSIMRGVTTTVTIERSSKTSYEIRVNGDIAKSAEVSEYIIKAFLHHIKEDYRVLVNHKVEVPVGSGFGSSGACALSLALALNEVFGLNLSRVEAAQLAHIAEVNCKTGLGTVIAENYGGLEIRVKPGAPGIGEIRHIPIGYDYVVACLSFGSIPTKKILSDNELRVRINKLGGKLVDELAVQPLPHNFMCFSRKFAEHLGLISGRVRNVLREADNKCLPCSMTMVGESVFSLIKRDLVDELLKIFHEHASSTCDIIVAEIDFKGARIT